MGSDHNNHSLIDASLSSCIESSFPPAILRLLDELVKLEPNFDDIAKTIKMDSGLTANVLGLVNSPFYGLSQKVTSLKKAAVVLGTRELLKTTLSASFFRSMQTLHPGKELFPVWRIMVWTAIASELIAEFICPDKKDHVYLCALLKDLSLLLMNKSDSSRLPECLEGQTLNYLQEGQLDQEQKIWGITHPELTLLILGELGIEDLACEAILHHHEMDNLDSLSGPAQAIALGTRCAELTVYEGTDPQDILRFKSLLKTMLSIPDEDLENLRRRMLEKYRSMLDVLGIEETAADQRLYELPIQDMQKYYFQSMDVVSAANGTPGIAKVIATHLRWNFGFEVMEIMLRDPLGKDMYLFACDRSGVRLAGGPAQAGDLSWSIHGMRYPIIMERENFGELRLGDNVSEAHQQELGIYIRFLAQAYEQYCMRQSALEMKAHTLENLPVGVARIDIEGRTLQVNRKLTEFLNISPLEKDVVRYLPVARFFGAEQEWDAFLADPDRQEFSRIFCAPGIIEGHEADRDRCLYFQANKRTISGKKEVLLVVEDISNISALEIQALKQREFLQKLVASMRDVVLTTDQEGTVTYASPSLPRQVLGKSLFYVANPVSSYGGIWDPHYLETSREPVEAVMMTEDRELKPFELIISPLQPTLGHDQAYLVVGRDLSTVRRLEERLKKQALYDGLTQLFNHDYFHTLFAREVERDKRIDRGHTAIIFIDLDRFKTINDLQGHQAGDDALRSVAKAIKSSIRTGMDYPCRYGGDEFAVILTEIDPKGLEKLASRIKKSVNQCWKEHISVSIGAALGKNDESGEDLLRRADKAAYKAKTSGGDRIVISD